MTPAEILQEIYKLAQRDWETIKERVDSDRRNGGSMPKVNDEPKKQMTEDEINRILYAKGIIGNIPDLSEWTEEDENWEPFEITGKPTSEIIIEDRG